MRVEDDISDRPLFCPICLYETAVLVHNAHHTRERCYNEFPPDEWPGICSENEDWVERRLDELARLLGSTPTPDDGGLSERLGLRYHADGTRDDGLRPRRPPPNI